MTDDIVLKVENLCKTFKIYPNAAGRVKEWLSLGRRIYHRDFVALENISFEVRKGGFLGIIGPNGAGKSTLLKLITGVLEPTSGTYQTSGKVLSLLELSGGMDNDLTGRENIIRSAQLLGFPEGYVENRMGQIADFAELGDFFDQPLGIYSSGMRIRLAFSMFAFLECDILILDEVLAVGDIFFRQKCYARLEELIEQKTAIILVTHSTGTVRQYCDDVIVLNKGNILYHGASNESIQKYFEIKKDRGIKINIADTYVEEDYIPPRDDQFKVRTDTLEWPADSIFNLNTLPQKSENKRAKLTQLCICDERGNPCRVFKQGETACIYYAYQVKENMGIPIAGFNLFTVKNLLIHSKNSIQLKAEHPRNVKAGDIIRYKQLIKLDLAPGNYIFNLSLLTMHPRDFDNKEKFSVKEFKEKLIHVIGIKPAGVIEIISHSQYQAIGLHGGICNLDGELYTQIILAQ
jgi:ABC-type polysaccharide/polyol phosphate transport system ATPase subunit